MYDSGSKRTGSGLSGWGLQDNHKGSARLFLGNSHKYAANLAPRANVWFLLLLLLSSSSSSSSSLALRIKRELIYNSEIILVFLITHFLN
jgi:hypothetical protein